MNSNSKNFFSDFFQKNTLLLLQLATFLCVFYFIILSYYCYWADSEIWALTLSKQLFENTLENHSLYFKIPFYLLLRFLYFLPGSNVDLLLSARIVFMLIGISNTFLTWMLAKNIYSKKETAYLATLTLVSCSMFINQGFRLRSDILSEFWNLLFLNYLFFIMKINFSKNWWKYFFNLFILNCFLLASTPKAIYFFFSQGVFAIILASKIPPENRKKYYLMIISAFFLPLFLAVDFLLISTLFSMTGGSNRFFTGYYSAWLYFKNALLSIDITNLESEKLFFIKEFLRKNIETSSLILTSLILIPLNLIQKNKNTVLIALRIQCFILILLASTYNDWLPFFIASLLPILTISATIFFEELTCSWFSILKLNVQNWRNYIFLSAAFLLIIKATYFFQLNLFNNSNTTQRSTIHALEKYFENYPNTNFYDVIGILPRNNSIYKFAGPGQDYENQVAAKRIADVKPNFLIYIKKMSYLEPEITNLIENTYADLGHGVYGKALKISFDSKDIRTVDYLGKKYYKMKSIDLLAQLDESIPNLFRERIYFYIHKRKIFEETPQEILFFPAAGTEPINLKFQSIEPKDLWGDGYILFANKKNEVMATVYAPIQFSHTEPMLFLFSFDSFY